MRRRIVGLAVLALLIGAAPAQACCRGVHLYPPHFKPGGPLAIGDSVMLGAARRLAHAGYEVNAREGRFMRHALAILRRRRHRPHRPSLVVVAIGTNAPPRYREITRALRLVGRGRTLALVTPKRSWRAIGARPIQRAARNHPRRVRVIDWVSYSAAHPEWFYSDGTHLRPSGQRAYTRLLATLIRKRRG